MKIIGLTGGIGSGKTTVANLFQKLGAPIIDADVISRQLTQKNTVAYQKIVEHFGKNILDTAQNIDRKQLRTLIFNNATEKKWLENLLHPLIRTAMKKEIANVNFSYCICVIPLLTESNKIDFIDRVIVIDTPRELQLERAKTRDKASTSEIQKIIASQADYTARLKMADDVILNHGNIEALEMQVQQLHQHYIKD